MEFDWDSSNIGHIARHDITPNEAEEAILIEPLETHVQPHEGEERVLCFGRPSQGGCSRSCTPNGVAGVES